MPGRGSGCDNSTGREATGEGDLAPTASGGQGGNIVPVLARGDRVDVIAPGSACKREQLELGIALLERWGLRARLTEPLFGAPGIWSNTDARRWADLRGALSSPDARAIWCVRGGYGSLRLLRFLERTRIKRQKLLIGFSDITVLHQYLSQRWGWPSLHAPNLASLAAPTLPAAHREELRRVLFGRQRTLRYAALRPLNVPARASGRVQGRLTGGNMKTLQSLMGTRLQPRWKEAIVVLEDVGERAYSVDRMLQQFDLAGVWRGVRALLLGDFTGAEERGGGNLLDEVFAGFAERVGFPVFAGMPVGHGRRQRPLPLHLAATLATGARGVLEIEWQIEA